MESQAASEEEEKAMKLKADRKTAVPTVEDVVLTAINASADLMVRAAICPETVATYADAMEEGAIFPPLDVFNVRGDGFLLADGWHRLRAAEMISFKLIKCTVHQGTKEDALAFALKANQQHGLRRTNADKRRAVEVAVKMWGNMSSHAVSEMCGVGDDLVEAVRKQLSENDSSPRVGKDGKTRAIRGARPPLPPAAPDPEREDAEKDAAESADRDQVPAHDAGYEWKTFENNARDIQDFIGVLEFVQVPNNKLTKAAAACRALALRLTKLADKYAE